MKKFEWPVWAKDEINSAKLDMQLIIKCIAFMITYDLSYCGRNDLVQSIFDNNSDKAVGFLNSMALAGGCWASHLQNETINDYDFFITKQNPNYDNLLEICAALDMKASNELQYSTGGFSVYNYIILAKSLHGLGLNKIVGDIKVQFILVNKEIDETTHINEHFRLEHTKMFMQNNVLNVSPLTFACIMNKRFVLCPGRMPDNQKDQKYIDRGYKVPDIHPNLFAEEFFEKWRKI